jgi:hypothetical protein
MPKFRKKPVVIEAVQFNDMNSYLEIVKWMKAAGNTFATANEVKYSMPIMLIQTLEGTMAANPEQTSRITKVCLCPDGMIYLSESKVLGYPQRQQ